ncbi:hypothetical protein KSP40_PGU018939 [Platanthera guangdongensis]|uniref:Uncharacterized protein n=1 Tax=Platanthera guangdongensis TaxID=2320717 RepID=A0ABR2LYB6_9ASPA
MRPSSVARVWSCPRTTINRESGREAGHELPWPRVNVGDQGSQPIMRPTTISAVPRRHPRPWAPTGQEASRCRALTAKFGF